MRVLCLSLLMVFSSLACAQPLQVIWDRSGSGPNSWFGTKVIALGDQNDDGYADFAVASAGGAQPGDSSEPKIEFFHGGRPPSTTPYMTYVVDTNFTSQLSWFAPAGDLNGDGYQDWMIWVIRRAAPGVWTVEIYWGGPTADLVPDMIMHIPINLEDIGAVGDFNGDGYDDLYRYHLPPLDYGEILYGGNPMDTVADWTAYSQPGHTYEAWPESFGDLNGDGYADFVSDSPNERITYIFLGGTNPDTVPAYTWNGFYSTHQKIIHDLNGDHRDELVLPDASLCTWAGPTCPQPPTSHLTFRRTVHLDGCLKREILIEMALMSLS
jgi:hypothetical protein